MTWSQRFYRGFGQGIVHQVYNTYSDGKMLIECLNMIFAEEINGVKSLKAILYLVYLPKYR